MSPGFEPQISWLFSSIVMEEFLFLTSLSVDGEGVFACKNEREIVENLNIFYFIF